MTIGVSCTCLCHGYGSINPHPGSLCWCQRTNVYTTPNIVLPFDVQVAMREAWEAARDYWRKALENAEAVLIPSVWTNEPSPSAEADFHNGWPTVPPESVARSQSEESQCPHVTKLGRRCQRIRFHAGDHARWDGAGNLIAQWAYDESSPALPFTPVETINPTGLAGKVAIGDKLNDRLQAVMDEAPEPEHGDFFGSPSADAPVCTCGAGFREPHAINCPAVGGTPNPVFGSGVSPVPDTGGDMSLRFPTPEQQTGTLEFKDSTTTVIGVLKPASDVSADVVNKPWTLDQVRSLNAFQSGGIMHPFTTHDRIEAVATMNGWLCPCADDNCDYEQDWAWAWMADGSWEKMDPFPPAHGGGDTPGDAIRKAVAAYIVSQPSANSALDEIYTMIFDVAYVPPRSRASTSSTDREIDTAIRTVLGERGCGAYTQTEIATAVLDRLADSNGRDA